MTNSTKLSPRDKTSAALKASGWTNDLTAARPDRRSSSGWSLDPNVWVRPAAHGGTWRIELDYRNRSGYTSDDKVRGAWIAYVASDAEWIEPGNGYPSHQRTARPGQDQGYRGDGRGLLIKNFGQHQGYPADWVLNALLQKDETRTLRERIEAFASNPDLAIWLACERCELRQEQERLRRQALEDEREARRRPVPVTDPEAFSAAAQKARFAARDLDSANGLTTLADIQALVSTLEAQVAILKEVTA